MLNCVSWNVRGLESPYRKYLIRIYLNLYKVEDVIMI